ncbi:MAG: tetratricopeptide repeat protein [Planctomycetaceae bacterium]
MNLLFAISLTIASFVPPAKPVALVHEVSGDVELRTAQGQTSKCQPKQLIYLYDGDELQVAREAQVTVGFLNDFHWEKLKPGRLKVTKAACEPSELVERLEPPERYRSKIARRGLESVERGSGRGAGLILRGAPNVADATPQVTPVLGETVTSDRPTLTWTEVPEAKSYQVKLFIGGSGRSVWSANSDKTRLAFPADQPALKRNRTYEWQVSVTQSDGTMMVIARSRFTVTSATVAEELDSVKPLTESTQPADLLVAIATYQTYNADGPATSACEKLAKLNPRDPDVQRLLAELYDRAGRTTDAKEAARRAESLDPKNKPKSDS